MDIYLIILTYPQLINNLSQLWIFDYNPTTHRIRTMRNEELWQSVLSDVELQVSRANFLTWLKNSRLMENNDEVVTVALPNHFAKEWVENKYDKLILGIVRNFVASVKKIEYVVEGGMSKPPTQRTRALVSEKQLSIEEFKVDPNTNLNPRYSLSSFVVGSSNELAYAAASAIIQSVGTKYNPLFIYGGVGLGKTHLIQGVGNEIQAFYKNKIKVKYVTSEKFTNDVVWAIRNKRTEDIKSAYRHVDVLIVDDIQFIGGKEKTEEEFFHTFNALYENNKQIIISSDRPPKSIPILEERLRSRFESGMIADVGFPDYETRVAIIKNKIQERGASLNDECVDFIAKKVSKSIREIEGILNKVIFYQNTYQKPVSMAQVEKIISEIGEKDRININPNQIIKAVSNFFEISTGDLTGKSRNKEFIEPRQIAMYLLRDMLDMSYPYIANKIGKRDHTTVIYAYKKLSKGLDQNNPLTEKLNEIKELVNKMG